METAILMIAFGSGRESAGAGLAAVDRAVRDRFPGRTVRWAYTSPTVRRRLAEKGREIPSPDGALADLAGEGFTRVAVQSLHVLAGSDFEHWQEVLSRCPGPARRVLGRPLLSKPEDHSRVARALAQSLAPARRPGEALVLVGHGTGHPAAAAYPALARELARLTDPVWVGCLESRPGPEEIRDELLAAGAEGVLLAPLLTLAGRHVQRDIGGQGEGSWRTVLTRAGLAVRLEERGLADRPEVAGIWLDNLAEALALVEGPGLGEPGSFDP